MKSFLLPLLALASLASAETVPVDPDAWRGVNKSVDVYKERYAPAPVDAAVVRRLWTRLADQGLPAQAAGGEHIRLFERSVEPDAKGVAKNRLVYVVEVQRAEPAGPVRNALLTRSFSHLVATSEDWSLAPDGARRVEIWRFTVELDGSLSAVVRQAITMKDAAQGARGQSEPDPRRSNTTKLRPSSPEVLQRWKDLSKELLLLGPVISI